MSTAMQGLIVLAKTAGEDLSGALFTFATLHSDEQFYQSNSGEAAMGVIVEANTSGNPVSVQCDGVAKIILGATLNAGDRVMPDNSGHAVAAVDSPAGNRCAGILLQGGDSGEVGSILLHAGAGA